MNEKRPTAKSTFLIITMTLLMATTRITLSRTICRYPFRVRTRLPKSQLCPLWSSSFSFCLQSLHRSTSHSPPPSLSFSTTCAAIPPSFAVSMAAPSTEDSASSLHDNPLLQDFDLPPFDSVEPKHVRPGIQALLKNLVCYFRSSS